jgi:hypothetical protein
LVNHVYETKSKTHAGRDRGSRPHDQIAVGENCPTFWLNPENLVHLEHGMPKAHTPFTRLPEPGEKVTEKQFEQ